MALKDEIKEKDAKIIALKLLIEEKDAKIIALKLRIGKLKLEIKANQATEWFDSHTLLDLQNSLHKQKEIVTKLKKTIEKMSIV